MNAHTKSFKTALLIAAMAMPMAVFADAGSDARNDIKKLAELTEINVKTVITEAITTHPSELIDIVTTTVKAYPKFAGAITVAAIVAKPDSAAAIISAAIEAAPSVAQVITKDAISIPSQSPTVTNAIIAASVSSVTEQAAANSAVKDNEKSTEGATASTDVLKEVILAEFKAACPTIVTSEACTAAATKAVKRAGAAANVDGFIDEIKVAVSAN